MVAATQENVNVDNESKHYEYLPEDENDHDYLIEFDPNEINNLRSQKWKCGECKIILRGDVSYEGHMNLHRQSRPHTCDLCRSRYRCRTALKRHKDLKHSYSSQNLDNAENNLFCPICDNSFHSDINFYLHQAVVHSQTSRCPFECGEGPEDNLKQHLQDVHQKDIISAAETFSDDPVATVIYQCFRCSEVFKKQTLFRDHTKLCQIKIENRLHDDDDDTQNGNVLEIVKFEESETSVKCTLCKRGILKRNLDKHMEMHKQKDEEVSNALDNTKSYLCAFCRKYYT